MRTEITPVKVTGIHCRKLIMFILLAALCLSLSFGKHVYAAEGQPGTEPAKEETKQGSGGEGEDHKEQEPGSSSGAGNQAGNTEDHTSSGNGDGGNGSSDSGQETSSSDQEQKTSSSESSEPSDHSSDTSKETGQETESQKTGEVDQPAGSNLDEHANEGQPGETVSGDSGNNDTGNSDSGDSGSAKENHGSEEEPTSSAEVSESAAKDGQETSESSDHQSEKEKSESSEKTGSKRKKSDKDDHDHKESSDNKSNESTVQTGTVPAAPASAQRTVSYLFSVGAKGKWTKKTNAGYAFTIQRSAEDSTALSHFQQLRVDDKTIEPTEYDISSADLTGALKGSLKASYLDSLKVGEHRLSAAFDDGTVEATFEVREAVKEKQEEQAAVTGTTAAKPAPAAAKPVVQRTTKVTKKRRYELWIALACGTAITFGGFLIAKKRNEAE